MEEKSRSSGTPVIRTLDEAPAAGQLYRCAEVVELRWTTRGGEEHAECAILVEVSTEGGIFLVDIPADPDTPVRIATPHGTLSGAVSSCSREGSCWALQVFVSASGEWFGGRYRPEVLVPESDSSSDAPVQPPGSQFFCPLPPRLASCA
jgi:hypothetical protein